MLVLARCCATKNKEFMQPIVVISSGNGLGNVNLDNDQFFAPISSLRDVKLELDNNFYGNVDDTEANDNVAMLNLVPNSDAVKPEDMEVDVLNRESSHG